MIPPVPGFAPGVPGKALHMDDTTAEPLSWMVVPDHHPVLDRDGQQAGYAASVVGDHNNGRFDGIVVGIDKSLARDPRLMLEPDQITELDTVGVHTTLTSDEIQGLPEYQPDQVWGASTKGKVGRIADKLGGDGTSAWDRTDRG
jgi:hypothetical protein